MVADALVEPPSASAIHNLVPKSLGRLTHRYGFRPLTTKAIRKQAGDGNSLPSVKKSIFSTGDTLGLVSDVAIFGYLDETNGWTDRGHAPPALGEEIAVEGFEGNQSLISCVESGDYIVMSWQSVHIVDGVDAEDPYVWAKVIHKNGDVHIPATLLSRTACSPLTVAIDLDSGDTVNDTVIIAYLKFESVEGKTASALYAVKWTEGDTSFSSPSVWDTDVRINGDFQKASRSFDMINLSASGGIVAYSYVQILSDDIKVRRRNAITDTLTHSATISTRADYSFTALCRGGTTVYVAAAAELGTGANLVDICRFAEADLSAGVVTSGFINDFADTTTIDTIGINFGLIRGGTGFICAASMRTGGAAVTKYRTITTGGTSGERILYNTYMTSQPAILNQRAYLGLCDAQNIGGFCSDFVIDLNIQADPSDYETPFAVSCGSIGYGSPQAGGSIGVTPFVAAGTRAKPYVAANNGYFPGASIFEASKKFDSITVFTTAVKIRVLDFDGKVKPVKVADGAAIVPGSICAWFDGSSVQELGWCGPPYIDNVDTQGGTVPAGDYTFQAVWHTYDSAGFLHRSPNSNVSDTYSATGSDAPIIQVKTKSLTMREPGANQGEYVNNETFYSYAADANDPTYRRVTISGAISDNNFDSSILTDDNILVIQAAGSRGPAIYTQGAVDFPAQNPGGCSCAALVGDRVWCGGFFVPDRVKYSDRFLPIDAGAIRFAPEFFDLQAFETRGYGKVVALENYEDSLLVFTENATFVISGNGPDNAGRGNNFSGLTLLSSQYGCVLRDSVVQTNSGVYFLSKQGLCVVGFDSGYGVKYVGNAEEEFRTKTCVGAVNYEQDSLVVWLFNDGTFVWYSYDKNVWGTWALAVGLGVPKDICIHQDDLYILTSVGVWKYDRTTFVDYENDEDNTEVDAYVESPWIKLNGLSGWQKTRYIMPLIYSNGDDFDVTVSLYINYRDTAEDTKTVTTAKMATFEDTDLVDFKWHKVLRNKAFKVRVADSPNGSTNQGMDISAIDFEVGTLRGSFKQSPNHRT